VPYGSFGPSLRRSWLPTGLVERMLQSGMVLKGCRTSCANAKRIATFWKRKPRTSSSSNQRCDADKSAAQLRVKVGTLTVVTARRVGIGLPSDLSKAVLPHNWRASSRVRSGVMEPAVRVWRSSDNSTTRTSVFVGLTRIRSGHSLYPPEVLRGSEFSSCTTRVRDLRDLQHSWCPAIIDRRQGIDRASILLFVINSPGSGDAMYRIALMKPTIHSCRLIVFFNETKLVTSYSTSIDPYQSLS